jgi:hypothetical protein
MRPFVAGKVNINPLSPSRPTARPLLGILFLLLAADP